MNDWHKDFYLESPNDFLVLNQNLFKLMKFEKFTKELFC